MIYKNNYLFTPWEKDFLSNAKNVKSNLDIVCPFIKLSIIKKILAALPNDIRINFRLLTRFNKQVFIQKSSDITVFDLLLNYASTKHNISIYKLNRLHAKIYIFDNEKMYVTSSNLSYSGLNSNFEIAVRIQDKNEINDVNKNISNLFMPEYQIVEDDIKQLSVVLNKSNKLFIKEALIEQTQIPEDTEEETYDNVVNDSGYKEEIADDIIDTEEQNRTLDEINNYFVPRGVPDYNNLDGVPFESQNRPLGISNKEWQDKALKDEKRISNYISQLFGNLLNNDNKKLNNIKNVFIHRTWRNAYLKDENIENKNKFFGMIGSAVFHMLITDSLIKKIVFSEDKIQRYYVKLGYLTQNYPYGNILSDIGCKFSLNMGNLKTNIDRELFEMFLGVLCISLSHVKFYNFYRKFLDKTNDFVYDNYFEYNSKSYLMEILHKNKQPDPRYSTISESGEEHQKEFKVAVFIGNKKIGIGKGKFKKEAEQQAAHNALIELGKKGTPLELNKKIFKPTKRYFVSQKRINDLKELNKNLPINLKDIGLLDITLTQPSFSNRFRETRSNGRLHYLGSFVDNYFKLYNMFFKNNGTITREVLDYIIKSTQVSPSKKYCQFFDELNLKQFLRIEIGSINDSIKSETVQALVGSIFIDKGSKGAQEFNLILWKEYLEMKVEVSLDDITRVQEIIQKTKKEENIIEYKVLSAKGPDNNREFVIGCFIEGILYGKGKGTSHKKARRKAAGVVLSSQDFLKKYNIEED